MYATKLFKVLKVKTPLFMTIPLMLIIDDSNMVMNLVFLNQISFLIGGKQSSKMNFNVVPRSNHIIVDEPLAIFQP